MIALEKTACLVQRMLPQRTLTALVYRFMRIRLPWFKNFQIRTIARLVGIDWSEAVSQNPGDYAHFNAFFTRELKPGVHKIDPDERILSCPVDGRVSELGPIDDQQIYQAKGRHYSLDALLAGEMASSDWRGGWFATIYLSPRDYHRIHMPAAGKLQQMTYVPGRLFSVAPYTVRHIDSLFAVNERVICRFDTRFGPIAVILVGAMLVAGMETVWAGEITPCRQRVVRSTDYAQQCISFEKGQEMGRVNMGSTVILHHSRA